MKGGKKAANWLGSQNKKHDTMMSPLCFLFALYLRLGTKETGNPETQTATDQKKKKNTQKKLLQKKSGLGPGKSSLARQKTFKP